MRYPASEKTEIIKIVEQSHLSVRKTLEQIGIPRATFYRWYEQYQAGGPEALEDRPSQPSRVWNRARSGAVRAGPPSSARNRLSAAAKARSPRSASATSTGSSAVDRRDHRLRHAADEPEVAERRIEHGLGERVGRRVVRGLHDARYLKG